MRLKAYIIWSVIWLFRTQCHDFSSPELLYSWNVNLYVYIHLCNKYILIQVYSFKSKTYISIRTDKALSLKTFYSNRYRASVMIWRFYWNLHLLYDYCTLVNGLNDSDSFCLLTCVPLYTIYHLIHLHIRYYFMSSLP